MMKGVILAFPQGFKVPQDQGGPGQGKLIGGFGGDPSKSRDDHRDAVQSIGKAPVILLHGNSGAADSGRWHMLDLQQMLIKAAPLCPRTSERTPFPDVGCITAPA